jgi:hypothetical protein
VGSRGLWSSISVISGLVVGLVEVYRADFSR